MALTTRLVDDLDSLKAVGHPLRMQLLGTLRRDGPATASELGRRLGESSGSTSYHLRQLERFGFVTDDAQQPSGRERRWVAAHQLTSFSPSLWDTPAGREHFDTVRRRQLEHLQAGLAAWDGPISGIGHSDYILHLDHDDLAALAADLEAVIERYAERTGAQSIALHVLTLPGDHA